MDYLFETGNLYSDKSHVVLCAENIRLGIIKNTRNNVGNVFLNGTFEVKGKLNNICFSNESRIQKGNIFTLKIKDKQVFSLIPILFLDILDIKPTIDKRRNYEWFFCGIDHPIHDQFKLIEDGIKEGEISLEELVYQLGSIKVEKTKFNSEGGILN
jgi:hypothetical protein